MMEDNKEELEAIENNELINTKRLGMIGEHYFLMLTAKLGLTVLEPRGDIDSYDFVIHHKNKFIRVQVKTSNTYKNGVVTFKIGKTSGYGKSIPYTKEDCDYMFLYSNTLDVYAFIPIEEMPKTPSITIRYDEPKIKQPNIKYFKNYLLTIALDK